MPTLINPLDYRTILPLIESSSRAVGMANFAASHHHLAMAWLARMQITEAVRCARADNLIVDEDRVLAHLVRVPLVSIRDYGADAHALRLLRTMRRAALTFEQRVQATLPGHVAYVLEQQAANESAEDAPRLEDDDVSAALSCMSEEAEQHTPLLATAFGIRRYWSGGGSRGVGHIAAPIFLANRGLTVAPLPFLAGSSMKLPSGRSARETDATLFAQRWLAAIEVGADEAVRSLAALAAAWTSWRKRIADRRSNSRLPQVLDLLAVVPMLTPASVRKAVGCEIRSAARLLDELSELGTIVEASGRRAWKVYVPADRATLRAVARRPPPLNTDSGASAYGEASCTDEFDRDLSRPPLRFDPSFRSLPAANGSPEFSLAELLADTDAALRKAKAAIESARSDPSHRR